MNFSSLNFGQHFSKENLWCAASFFDTNTQAGAFWDLPSSQGWEKSHNSQGASWTSPDFLGIANRTRPRQRTKKGQLAKMDGERGSLGLFAFATQFQISIRWKKGLYIFCNSKLYTCWAIIDMRLQLQYVRIAVYKSLLTSTSLLACSRNTWAYSLTSFSFPLLAASMSTNRGTLVSRKESEMWSITAFLNCNAEGQWERRHY